MQSGLENRESEHVDLCRTEECAEKFRLRAGRADDFVRRNLRGPVDLFEPPSYFAQYDGTLEGF